MKEKGGGNYVPLLDILPMFPSGPPESSVLNKPDETVVFLGSALSGEGNGSRASGGGCQTADDTFSILKCSSATAGQGKSGRHRIHAHTEINKLLQAEVPTRVIRRTILLFVQGGCSGEMCFVVSSSELQLPV